MDIHTIKSDRIACVTEFSQLLDVVRHVKNEKFLAVDMESNGFYTYPEQICLIQLATDKDVYLIDTKVINDIEPLGEIFSDPYIQKIMHSCDYDIRSFDRDYGFCLRNIFDTAVAASFCGVIQTGLDNVLKKFLNVSIVKTKRLQRADWGKRPLTSEMLTYAADDVNYLIHLYEVQKQKLKSLERLKWVYEECRRLEAIRYVPPKPPEENFLNTRGIRELTPQELAIFKELFIFRDAEALRTGKPPFKIIPTDALLTLAKNPHTELSSIAGIGSWLINRAGHLIKKAIHDGLTASPVYFNHQNQKKNYHNWTKTSRQCLSALKKWRQKKSNALGLSPNIIWPTRSLEILALYPSKRKDEIDLKGSPEPRKWQRTLFKREIEEILTSDDC
jgi:ribonuclease D